MPLRQDNAVEVVDLATLQPVSPPVVTATTTTTSSSFQSYVQKGCQLEFCVAIDFTSSNGDPAIEGSCHYAGNGMNDYEETISALGWAVSRYSVQGQQQIPVWGFGAKFGAMTRHVFQCGPTPTVTGVDGILEAYRSVFQSDLVMSGPTVFVQVLQAAAARAHKQHTATVAAGRLPHYTILLIITDGIMNDFEETRQRLDMYSTLPLSVIFVGVGRSDFSLLYRMCEQPPAAGRGGGRNITTFCEFHRHQHDPAALGEAALRNVPSQLCEYMQSRGL
jgi:hypothetical protein